MRVMLVDDDPFVTRGLARNLEAIDETMDVILMPGVSEALAAMEKGSVDVLVTDLCMPGQDGTALLREARERYPCMLRFVLSGEAKQEQVLNASLLAHRYLSKPCDAEMLRQVIMESIQSFRRIQNPAVAAVVSRLVELPARKHTLVELMRLLGDEHAETSSIIGELQNDPAMVARLLKIANSPYFGHSGQIYTLDDAINIMGIELLASIAGSRSLLLMNPPRPESMLSVEELWQHCIEVMAMVKQVGRHLKLPKNIIREATTAAILHDIGKLILAYANPYGFAAALAKSQSDKIPAWQAEHAIFGNHHAEVGAYLLKLWGLPEPSMRAVAFQHAPHLSNDSEPGASVLLHIADFMVNIHGSKPVTVNIDRTYLESLKLPSTAEHWSSLTLD